MIFKIERDVKRIPVNRIFDDNGVQYGPCYGDSKIKDAEAYMRDLIKAFNFGRQFENNESRKLDGLELHNYTYMDK